MKFGVREIVDVVFKASDTMKIGTKTFKKYQPVFTIDTATTSSLEQATTTVYAQGGKGNARLIAWEGEKTMTFTVTDALMSPMGLKVLTGAGLINPASDKPLHVHVTLNKMLSNGVATVYLDDLINETGLDTATSFQICNLTDVQPYATKLDGSGAGIDWYDNVKLTAEDGAEFVEVNSTTPATFTVKDEAGQNASGTVQLDFYLIVNNKNAMTEVQIAPESFGGFFYIEAQTLFRREDSGKDMAAEIIIPRAKIQSAFTFTMAASGDPSTFDFVMDAFPAYTRFDTTKKQMCVIQILGTDNTEEEEEAHVHATTPDPASPVFHRADSPVNTPDPVLTTLSVTGTKVSSTDVSQSESQANQDEITVTSSANTINIVADVDGLEAFTTMDGTQKWVGVTVDTGVADIAGVKVDGSLVSVTDGKFNLWIDAEDTFPKTYVISATGYADTTITITLNA
jgi:hypothetical protein